MFHWTVRLRFFVVILLLGVPFLFPVGVTAGDELAVGPLVSRFKLTLEQGEREEAFGPLSVEEESETRELTAMPPLWSCTKNLETGGQELDVLYPVLTYDRTGDEYRLQILQWFSFSGGVASGTDTNVSRFTLFPFYFQQRSAVPEKNYTALFPFYGQLKNRMLRDEMEFVLWPIYIKTTRKARVDETGDDGSDLGLLYRYFRSRRGDVTTYNFLVPFFHVRRGPGLRGWQFWPLAGSEHKQTITWTNRYDELVVDGGHEKNFVLWPFFMKQRTGIGTTNEENQTILLPFFSVAKSPMRDSITAPWPLFTYTVDRGRGYREWDAPWPLVVFARGEGKYTSRVWPFFSQAHTATLESDFYLWPLYGHRRVNAPPLDQERTHILLFLYSDLMQKNTETGVAKRRVDMWPFFTFTRDWEGNERWQTFSILEPFLPASKSIERNYSPIWSVVRAERNAKTGAHSESLFWNLYRHESTVTNRQSSLLFGLAQWRVTPEGRKSRWFHIPVDVAY